VTEGTNVASYLGAFMQPDERSHGYSEEQSECLNTTMAAIKKDMRSNEQIFFNLDAFMHPDE